MGAPFYVVVASMALRSNCPHLKSTVWPPVCQAILNQVSPVQDCWAFPLKIIFVFGWIRFPSFVRSHLHSCGWSHFGKIKFKIWCWTKHRSAGQHMIARISKSEAMLPYIALAMPFAVAMPSSAPSIAQSLSMNSFVLGLEYRLYMLPNLIGKHGARLLGTVKYKTGSQVKWYGMFPEISAFMLPAYGFSLKILLRLLAHLTHILIPISI